MIRLFSAANVRARAAAGIVVGAVIASVMGACGSTSFTPGSHVDTLRVLAVRADLPLAKPGETVSLEALVAYPAGDPSSVSFAWGTCVNPGSPEVADCARAVTSYARGDAKTSIVVPKDALDALPDTSLTGLVGVIFVACAGELRDEPTDTAPLSCYDARGARVGREGFVWGMKRIVVTDLARNANPTIAAMAFDGVRAWDESTELGITKTCDADDVADCPSSTLHLVEAIAAPGSAETSLGRQEDLVAFFYVSAGDVQDEFARESGGSFSTVLAPTRVAAGRTITIWTVLRDDRGGVDWTTRTLRLASE